MGERLVATACGVVERVNKLVSVRTLRSRYGAEVGDVVVGRVTEVRPARLGGPNTGAAACDGLPTPACTWLLQLPACPSANWGCPWAGRC